jgi:hypothetical protein
MMRPQEEIEKEVLRLQSEVASCDLLLNKYTAKESQRLYSKYFFRKEQILVLIRVLEWTLGREPNYE